MRRLLVLLLITVTGCSSAATSSTSSNISAPPATTTSVTTTTEPSVPTIAAPVVEGSLSVAEAPTAVATGARRLWVASASGIDVLDPTTGTVMVHVPFPGTVALALDTNIATSSSDPPRLAACSATQTVEIGTVTGVISATYPWGCTGIAVGAGALWIVRDVQLVELGPQGDLVSTVDVDDGRGVAVTRDAVWVIEGGSGHPQLREMRSGLHDTVATYPLDATPDAVIADDAGVWVSERAADGTETLVGFGTPATPRLHRYPSGSGGEGMDFSGRFLWVANDEGGVSVVDTNSGELVASPLLASAGPVASSVRVVATDGRLFVAGREPGVIERVHPGSFGNSLRLDDAPSPIRIEVATGCPDSIADAAPVLTNVPFANPDSAGLGDALVPGRPVAAIVCAYGDVEEMLSALGSTAYVGGALERSGHLDADAAATLAETANATAPANFVSTCTPDLDGPRYTVVAFSFPGRSDVDIWYEDESGCPVLSNGHRTIGPLINGFGADLSQLLDSDLTSVAAG